MSRCSNGGGSLTSIRKRKENELDLGDYADNFYSVQTTDGEKISQLISGYVDIILKKKQAKDHFGIEGDEEATMYEESVSPAKATIIQHQSSKVGHANMGSVALPAVLRAGGGGPGQFSTGTMQQAMYSQVTNQAHPAHTPVAGQNPEEKQLTQAQRALLGNIDAGLNAVNAAQNNLQNKGQVPDLGDDESSRQWRRETEDVTKQNVESQLSAMNAATVQMITQTAKPEDQTDYSAVGSAVATISSNIGEFSRDMRMLAALQEEDNDGDRLMDAARKLAGAFTDLLTAAQPGTSQHRKLLHTSHSQPRQDMLAAASNIGEHSGHIMRSVGYDETDNIYEGTLAMLAKAVANATATLVLTAKKVANVCEGQSQGQVIQHASQCAQTTSQLVSCSKAVAPTIQNPGCQEQLDKAARITLNDLNTLMQTAETHCPDENILSDLNAAANEVTKALNEMLGYICSISSVSQTEVERATNAELIITATDRIYNSAGDKDEMVRQAKILAQATSDLVQAIKFQADGHTDSEEQKKLLAAAKQLADATAKLVEAAKGCATQPPTAEQEQKLRQAAEDVKNATYAANAGTLRRKLIKRLETAAKNAASAATQLINCANGATPYNTNKAAHSTLMHKSKDIADTTIPQLVQGIRATMSAPDSSAAQMQLINASQNMLQPGTELTTMCKSATSTITEQAISISVRNASHALTAALTELRTAALKAQQTGNSTEIDAALEQVKILCSDINNYQQAVQQDNLRPLPGQNPQGYETQVGATSKTVGSLMAQLLSAADRDNANYTGMAARDTAHALKVLTQGIRGVVTSPHTSRPLREKLLNCAYDVMVKSGELINEAKNAINHPNDPENKARLAQVAKAVSQSLHTCVGCLPNIQEVDSAVKYITTVNMRLVNGQFVKPDCSYQEAQSRMSNNAVALNEAASDIVTASHENTAAVAKSTQRYSKTYEIFLDSGLQLAGSTSDVDSRDQLVSSLKSVSMMSNKLLYTTKSHLVDPNAPNSRHLLANAARAVTDSINHLIDVCTVSAPGQKECDNALRRIQMMRSLLENPCDPVSQLSFYDCLESVVKNSQLLGTHMPGISTNAKQQQLEPFCVSVREFANAICGVTENAAQAAYLVGIADKASEPGRPGLVDQTEFHRAHQAIQNACMNLTNPTTTQQQLQNYELDNHGQERRQLVLSVASLVANNTSSLCNTARNASQRTSNPVAKQQFIKSAKDVANGTAGLVTAIKRILEESNKELDIEFSAENRRRCADASAPLIHAVEQLTTFAASPEFASVPAKISTEAKNAQQPVTQSGKALIDGACQMIQAAKQLAVSPKDPPTYQQYSHHSKTVSEALIHLIQATKTSAPGQSESARAIERMTTSIRDLDQASLAAVSQSLPPQDHNSYQGYQEQLNNSVQELYEMIEPVRNAGCSQAEKLGHLVTMMADYVQPLAAGAIGCASKNANSRMQMSLLDQSKTVAECASQLVYAAKEGGGNHKAVNTHEGINEAAQLLHEAVQELMSTLEEVASSTGMVNTMLDTISKSMAKTEDNVIPPSNMSYVDFQTSMVKLARQIARTSQDMVGKSGSNVAELGGLANLLTRDYGHLAHETAGAVATAQHAQIGRALKAAVQDLGAECRDLVKIAGQLQGNPGDAYSNKELNMSARRVTEKVGGVLNVLRSGSKGTQACINAASTVSGIIGDLDTTIMFASAGTLSADGQEIFSDHRENILKTAKSLVEDTKTLVAGAASTQDKLADAAQSAMMTIIELADCVKHGAASLGAEQPEAQVLLINAVKDVAQALGDLISATKNASGKEPVDPSMETLKDNAKTMVTNVTSLLKTVKTVEDEAARGTRALESSIEAIRQELKAYAQTDRVEKILTPEDLIRATKPLTMATGKAVAAGNSGKQDDVIVIANQGRKAIRDMLYTCKCAAAGAEDHEARQTALQAGHHCAAMYRDLLEQVNAMLQKQSPENRQKLAHISKLVAEAVRQLVSAAEALKASTPRPALSCQRFASVYAPTRSGNDWVNPDDLTALAEMELLGAANSIEAAAKKLSQLQPRPQPQQANENLNFDGQILEAAKCIAAATAALVKSASAAQRELVAQGKANPHSYSNADRENDEQWSQGLISAARLVAVATHSLCDAANAMVQGHATEEKLISAAKEVAASTAQLLVASKVRADADSLAMRRLQEAGHAVKRATDCLVKASLRAKNVNQYEEADITVNSRLVSGITQIINIKEEILTKERELNMARHKLETIRRAKYKGQSDCEEDGYGSSF